MDLPTILQSCSTSSNSGSIRGSGNRSAFMINLTHARDSRSWASGRGNLAQAQAVVHHSEFPRRDALRVAIPSIHPLSVSFFILHFAFLISTFSILRHQPSGRTIPPSHPETTCSIDLPPMISYHLALDSIVNCLTKTKAWTSLRGPANDLGGPHFRLAAASRGLA